MESNDEENVLGGAELELYLAYEEEDKVISGGSVVIGGVPHSLVGWGQYEIDKRKVEHDTKVVNNHAEKYYSNKSHILPEDAIESILSNTRQTASADSIKLLTESIKKQESANMYKSPAMTILPISSDYFSTINLNDKDNLLYLYKLLSTLVSLEQTALPDEPISTISNLGSTCSKDTEKIIELEGKVAEYVEYIEKLQLTIALLCTAFSKSIS